MAYRVFPSGQVPTAEVLQKYLMNQVVIGCTSTSRPPTPIDGMTVFETDTGAFRVWRGGVWALIAKVGQWDDDGDLHVSGSIDAVGGITAGTDLVAAGNVLATGDVTARGLRVGRLVKGKVHTGTAADSSSSSTTIGTVSFANVQNVPVVAGHAYRAIFQVMVGGSLINDRIRYTLWNGAVNGTQLSDQEPIIRNTRTNSNIDYETVTLVFMWNASSTTTIANVTLGHCRFSGTGVIWTRIEVPSFVATIEDLGLASTITNL